MSISIPADIRTVNRIEVHINGKKISVRKWYHRIFFWLKSYELVSDKMVRLYGYVPSGAHINITYIAPAEINRIHVKNTLTTIKPR